MKVELKQLNDAIKMASVIAPKRPIHPVLETLLFEKSQSTLYIAAFNLSRGIITSIPIQEADSSEIKFMIGSQLIKDLLKSRIGTIEIAFVDNKLGLTSGGSRIELETYTDSDFPELPDLTRAIASFSLNSKILKKAITACKKIATHPITINSTSNLLTIQGTDGHSVTLYRSNLETSTPDFAFTFDPAALRINDKGDTTISIYSDWISFTSKSTTQFSTRAERTVNEISIKHYHPLSYLHSAQKNELQRQLDIAACYGMKEINLKFDPDWSTIKIEGQCETGALFSEILAETKFTANILIDLNAVKKNIKSFAKEQIILEIAYGGKKEIPCLIISQPGCDYSIAIAAKNKLPALTSL